MKAFVTRRFSFTAIISGLDPDDDDFEARLDRAGCDDATLFLRNGVIALDFSRYAKNFVHAVVSVADDVGKAGGRLVRLEPDPLVTASEIADRFGVSRQAILNYIQGRNGPGHFPLPVARVTNPSPLFNWLSVTRWLKASGRVTVAPVVEAAVVQYLNDALTREEPPRARIRPLLARIRAAAEPPRPAAGRPPVSGLRV